MLAVSVPPGLLACLSINSELELDGVFLFGRGFAANYYLDQSSLLPGNAVRGLFEGCNRHLDPTPRVVFSER